MRDTMTTEDLGSAFGAPRSGDSLSEILRALSVLVGRQQMRQWLDRVASDAGMDLPIADGWVLVQLRRGRSEPPILGGRPALAVRPRPCGGRSHRA